VTSVRQHVVASSDTGALPAAIRENVRSHPECLRQHVTTFFLENRSKIAILKGKTDEGDAGPIWEIRVSSCIKAFYQ
jgi:hypothetical protein